MAYRTREEKEAYKAGIRKGQQMVTYAGYGGHETDQETQTERLIKAINDLTAAMVTSQPKAQPNSQGKNDIYSSNKEAVTAVIRNLQYLLGTRQDGIIGVKDIQELRRYGAAVPFLP